jgi:hypothetical protein
MVDGKPVSLTKIVRGKLRDGAWVEQQTIWQAPLEFYRPGGGVHFGCRIAFDRDGYLYSLPRPAPSRRSGPTATATRRASISIHAPASSGKPSTARAAATNSTSSAAAATTAGT